MTRMMDKRERLEQEMNSRDSSEDELYHGWLYLLQRILFTRDTAQLFARFRAEHTEIARNRPADRPDEPAWVATQHDWPIDGSWQPDPNALEVLSRPEFDEAVRSLPESLKSQPITGSEAFRKLEAEWLERHSAPPAPADDSETGDQR